MRRYGLRRILGFLGFAVVFVGLASLAVMALWNAILPSILGVTTITFWQALGLLVLSRILFGGYGWQGGYGGRAFGRHGYGPNRAEWKHKMANRWQQMTPEQRERMKAQWRNRCGGGRGGSRWGTQPEQPAQDPPTPTAI